MCRAYRLQFFPAQTSDLPYKRRWLSTNFEPKTQTLAKVGPTRILELVPKPFELNSLRSIGLTLLFRHRLQEAPANVLELGALRHTRFFPLRFMHEKGLLPLGFRGMISPLSLPLTLSVRPLVDDDDARWYSG